MAKLRPPVTKADQQTGNLHSKTTLVEFGDYECPHCGHAYPLLKQLLKERGDEFRFVFRNFPLQEAHPLALPAALAAEAAGKQGKFWQMHDLIYENQNLLSEGLFLEIAKKLKLDIEQFVEDMESEPIVSKVEDDFESGVRSGVNGTPSFFLNEIKVNTYDGSYESLSALIESAKVFNK